MKTCKSYTPPSGASLAKSKATVEPSPVKLCLFARPLNLSDGLLFVEYENETIPKKFRKKESITFSSKFSYNLYSY